MRGTFKFKGNKKLGNEFDPEITGEDGFDFDDYDGPPELWLHYLWSLLP